MIRKSWRCSLRLLLPTDLGLSHVSSFTIISFILHYLKSVYVTSGDMIKTESKDGFLGEHKAYIFSRLNKVFSVLIKLEFLALSNFEV